MYARKQPLPFCVLCGSNSKRCQYYLYSHLGIHNVLFFVEDEVCVWGEPSCFQNEHPLDGVLRNYFTARLGKAFRYKKTKYIKHFQAIPEPELTFQSSLKAEQYFIALGLKMFFFNS